MFKLHYTEEELKQIKELKLKAKEQLTEFANSTFNHTKEGLKRVMLSSYNSLLKYILSCDAEKSLSALYGLDWHKQLEVVEEWQESYNPRNLKERIKDFSKTIYYGINIEEDEVFAFRVGYYTNPKKLFLESYNVKTDKFYFNADSLDFYCCDYWDKGCDCPNLPRRHFNTKEALRNYLQNLINDIDNLEDK